MVAVVRIGDRSVTRCVQVSAAAADGGVRTSGPITGVEAGQEISVAIFQGEQGGEQGEADELGEQVTIQAAGHEAADCSGIPDVLSDSRLARFLWDREVVLTLAPEWPCDDRQDGDRDGHTDCADRACQGEPVCAPIDGGTDGGMDGGETDGGSEEGPFPYPPSNFSPETLPRPDAGLVINCDAGYSTRSLAGWLCGAPIPPAYPVDGGAAGTLIVMPLTSLTIASSGQWRITGDRPFILAVYGDAEVNGPLLAGAVLDEAGPGGSWPGCPGAGGQGLVGGNGGGGGGGGGYGTAGAPGGASGPAGGTRAAGGDAGPSFGTAELVPLLGGCPGGAGGQFPGSQRWDGGGGGGALQLSVAGQLTVRSQIGAPGGGGKGGDTNGNSGGSGGGSGGAVLLEARRVALESTARITANGGAGAEGDDNAPATFQFGENGRTDGPSAARGGRTGNNAAFGGDGGAGQVAPLRGEDFRFSTGGGGGGGGAVGRIRVNSVEGCVLGGPAGLLFSPRPTSNLAGDAGCP
jgi:hypothetical protein